ncbi:protein of unknown function DUF4378 [Dillenia turbinata]|uniref:DUF4378 domain-containing protein n=1 Tax=Dillenia turbinata TaxID=194707 RepID=A0AAN8VF04_9MAGN
MAPEQHSSRDERPDIQRQIGCMNGFFHLFIVSKRMNNNNQKRLPPGQIDKHVVEPSRRSEKTTKKTTKQVVKEKQRNSTESSHTSISSSSCSSTLSSVDSYRTAQPEFPSSGQNIFPKNPSQNSCTSQTCASSQSEGQSVNIQNVVKFSINREIRASPVRTATREEAIGRTMKHVDSPRPFPQSKLVEPKASSHSESFRVLNKLREVPSNSHVERGNSMHLPSKVARRFSCDGRESEVYKASNRLKELPRLSLDGNAGSIRSPRSNLNLDLLRDFQKGKSNYDKVVVNQQQEPGSNKRPSNSVVAKLMGLEALPDSISLNEGPIMPMRISKEGYLNCFPGPPITDECKKIHISRSPKNSPRYHVQPQIRNDKSLAKAGAISKFPLESAPWKQLDGNRGTKRAGSRGWETLKKPPSSAASVYGEIEKRLTELEFRKSGKDLRALKQILEAMQRTKGMLEAKQEDQPLIDASRRSNDNASDTGLCQRTATENCKSSYLVSVKVKDLNSLRNHKAPIVIMKPAKPTENFTNPAASITDGSPGLRRLRIGVSADSSKGSLNNHAVADQTPRNGCHKDSCSHATDKGTNSRTPRMSPNSTVPRQMIREKSSNSGRSSGTVSPRMQKKPVVEKQSHPTTPSSDLNRARRQSSRLTDSGSTCRRYQPKTSNTEHDDDQLSENNSETRSLSHAGDTISQQSDNSISFLSPNNTEVTSTDGSNESKRIIQCNDWKSTNPIARLNKKEPAAELAATPEQPSPVSVLDVAFYRDESPSPVKKISNAFKDDETRYSEEAEWNLVELNHLSDRKKAEFSSEIDNRLEDIKSSVNMFAKLIHPQDIENIDFVSTFRVEKNPDHKYIAKVLLASGLLLSNLTLGLTKIQIHPSGHLINPNLYFDLEKIEAGNGLTCGEGGYINIIQKKCNEKIHRKLIFDAVNEILTEKLASACPSRHQFWDDKVVRRTPNGQDLLQDLCSEVDHLQTQVSGCDLDDEDDDLKSILWNDMMHHSQKWTNFSSGLSGVILDVERLIFKDLMSDIVTGETACLHARLSRHCRQLFTETT